MKRTISVFNYKVTNESDDTLDIDIDGVIVDAETQEAWSRWFGDETSVSYKSIRDQIRRKNPKTINYIINSPGGHVGDAMAIHDMNVQLRNDGVTVNTKGTGIVASAATYILMSGDKPAMTENSWFMIHNVSGAAWGSLEEMESYVRMMRKFNDRITAFYSKATGLSETVIGNMMNKETWLTADEAKENNFIKTVTEAENFTNEIKADHWQFNNITVLNAYNKFLKPKNTSDMDTTKIQETITNGFNALLEKLGLKNKADEQATKDAFTEFSKSITDELAKIDVPTNETIQKLVDQAINKASESFVKGDDIKDMVKKDDIKDMATKADLKDSLKKEDLQELNNSIEEIKNALAGSAGKKTTNQKNENEQTSKAKINPKNIFKGQQFFPAEN
ncbi:MAG: head maturation protease, ClpP-related [Agriterribacter sp.]